MPYRRDKRKASADERCPEGEKVTCPASDEIWLEGAQSVFILPISETKTALIRPCAEEDTYAQYDETDDRDELDAREPGPFNQPVC